MNKLQKLDKLPFGVALFAAAGFFLRSELYRVGLDEKNLLVRSHPLALALWGCTALTALLVLWAAGREGSRGRFEDCFEPSAISALGHILAAAGIAMTVLLNVPAAAGPIGTAWKVAGLMSAPLLCWAAFCRALGKRPFFGSYGVCSVFFALHMVCHYQIWCSDPQLQNYIFSFFGSLAMMLFGYYQSALAADCGKSRLLRITGLLAAYFCLVALSRTEYLYLYLGCAVWAISSLSSPVPRQEERTGEAHGSA